MARFAYHEVEKAALNKSFSKYNYNGHKTMYKVFVNPLRRPLENVLYLVSILIQHIRLSALFICLSSDHIPFLYNS